MKDQTKPIPVRLTLKEQQELDKHAELASLSRSEYIRQALMESYRPHGLSIAQKKEREEILKEMLGIKDLIGSTNLPKETKFAVEGSLEKLWLTLN